MRIRDTLAAAALLWSLPAAAMAQGAVPGGVPECRAVSVANVGIARPEGAGEPAAIFQATFVKDGALFERGLVFTWAFVLPDGADKVVRGSETIGRKRLTVDVELGRTEVPPGDMDFGQLAERLFVTACRPY